MRLFADLPSSPSFDRWVLEQPLPLAAVCLITGVALVVALVRRGQATRGFVGGGIFLCMSAAILTAGMLIETPRERIASLTSEFVRSVFAADADWAEQALHDPLVIASAGNVMETMTRADLVATIRNFEAFGTREWVEKPRGSTLDSESSGRTQTTIRVSASFLGNQMMPSTWEFTWLRGRGDQWRITRIECLTMWGQPPRMDWEREARKIANMKPGGGKGALRPDGF